MLIFLTINKLKSQKNRVIIPPDNTTSQLVLSIPTKKGETTMLAKDTWPISRYISDKILIWESVNSIQTIISTNCHEI